MLKLLAASAALIAAPVLLGAPAFAQAPASVAAAGLSTASTTIGDLMDNPDAKAILMKHLPDVVGSDQIEMAKGMTLRDIQQYAADTITDAKLAAIDAELSKLGTAK